MLETGQAGANDRSQVSSAVVLGSSTQIDVELVASTGIEESNLLLIPINWPIATISSSLVMTLLSLYGRVPR